MVLHSLLLLCSINFNCDTLKLPLFNGEIKVEEVGALEPPSGLLIMPTSDSIVRSCTDGLVLSSGDFNSVLSVLVKTGNLYFSYDQLDSVFVAKGQIVKMGLPIGLKQHNKLYDSLFFTVCRYDRKAKAVIELGNINRFLAY